MMRKLLCLLILALSGYQASANHVFGADFFYTHLSGKNYRVTLVMYGDCGSGSFTLFNGAAPQVELLNHNAQILTVQLGAEAPLAGVEVTPVCPAMVSSTRCNGGTIPGVKRFTYSAIVTVPDTSSAWKFRFTGYTGTGSAGRSIAITNIPGGNSIMVLEAELDNRAGPNSSPQFTSIPTPFFCINLPAQYNPGPVDADGDSLAFALAPALTTGGALANYAAPYTATSPLMASSLTFDPINGQLSFTPNAAQQNTVVNKVVEYRNGVQIGTAMREMTFIVVSTCTNSAPSGTISAANSNVTGGVAVPGNIVNVCEGTGLVQFDIFPTDPAGDSFSVAVTGLMNGATANITGNSSPAPVIHFSWNAGTAPVGTYTFFVNYKDRGCPLSANQTQAYTVRIVKPPTATHVMTFPTRCIYKAGITYTISNGLPPFTITVKQGNTVVSSITGSAAPVIADSLPAGNYTATISSPSLLCTGSYSFSVADSGSFPFPPRADTGFYCLNDAATALTATPYPGGMLSWFAGNGTPLPSAPVPSTATAGQTFWLVSQTYKVCSSGKDTARVFVTPRPVASFELPSEGCEGSPVTLVFNGTIGVGPILTYTWDLAGGSSAGGNTPGPFPAVWDTAGVKTVRLQVAENKCPSLPVTKSILIDPTPDAVFTAGDICRDAPLRVQYNTAPVAGATYAWDFDGATPGSGNAIGPYFPVWQTDGEKTITLIAAFGQCADTQSRTLIVLPRPEVLAPQLDKNPCLGDKIYLQASGGGSTITWTPAERIYQETDGRVYTRAMTAPITYAVHARNEYGCEDSASFTLLAIEQCCQLSYPNAFSPNGDGRNDKFRVVTYGNMDKFELAIYNRWGGQVYHSYVQKEAWDGTVNGIPAEAGLYMYYVRARCLTGRSEEHKGEVMLIR